MSGNGNNGTYKDAALFFDGAHGKAAFGAVEIEACSLAPCDQESTNLSAGERFLTELLF